MCVRVRLKTYGGKREEEEDVEERGRDKEEEIKGKE